nr:unnamed protein product [Digitaria exilis]
MSASAEAKLWQREAGSLRQQLHNLQEHHRQLLGQQLSGLDVKDLQSLENKLEMSLRNIRMKKDQLMIDQIQELNAKVCLHNSFKVYGHGVNEHPESSKARGNILNTENEDALVTLELSQPQSAQRDKSETPSIG